MTPPPDDFGAHDRAAMLVRKGKQFIKTGAERLGLRIVRVVAERRHAPERIRRWRRILELVTPAAERAQMPVADALGRQRLGEGVAIELRSRARARDRPHVDDQIYVDLPTQRDELPVVPPYRLDLTVSVLRRLATNVVDVLTTDGRYVRAFDGAHGPVIARVGQTRLDALTVTIEGDAADHAPTLALVRRTLGVDRGLTPWTELQPRYRG